MNRAIEFLVGLLFGWGLLLSGMTDPGKVQGFLDLFGAWDPSLAFVMGGAIGVGVFAFALAKRRTKTFLGGTFHLPTSREIDKPLVVGALIFGAGWGLAGFCPRAGHRGHGGGTSSRVRARDAGGHVDPQAHGTPERRRPGGHAKQGR